MHIVRVEVLVRSADHLLVVAVLVVRDVVCQNVFSYVFVRPLPQGKPHLSQRAETLHVNVQWHNTRERVDVHRLVTAQKHIEV